MTAVVTTPGRQLPVVVTSPVAVWFEDGWTVTKRNLIKIKRSPDMLVFAVLRTTRVHIGCCASHSRRNAKGPHPVRVRASVSAGAGEVVRESAQGLGVVLQEAERGVTAVAE
jgi:hypothetical protein